MIIFTDGSFSPKPNIAGFGAVLLINDRQYSFGTYDNRCVDNNVAEVGAIAMALQYVKEHKIDKRDEVKSISIISDSAYALRKISNRLEGKDEFEQSCLNLIYEFLDKS
jgi:ribonuclease HI